MSIPTNKQLLPRFDVLINGSPLPRSAELQLISVVVDEDVNLPNMFTLEFGGLNDKPPRVDVELVDDNSLFGIGNAVEVKLGYRNDKIETLIKGEITALEPEFHFNLPPSFRVRGYDRSHRLQRGRKTRSFLNQKDSDIVARIASEAQLTPKTENSKVVHEYILQANQTDMEFLLARAHQIQYEVGVEDKTLFFRPVQNAKREILTLTFKDDLLEFYPRLSASGQVGDITVQGWNPKQKAKITAKSQTGDQVSQMGGQKSAAATSKTAFGNASGVWTHHPVINQAEADQLAKANLNQGVLMYITGEGVCHGRTDLRAGKVIKIEGENMSKRFTGQYYVTATSHRLNAKSAYGTPSGYFTHFTFNRNAL